MKVKDIVQEGVFDRLGKAFTGDLNAQARELRKQQRDQERQQADDITNPATEPAELNPLMQTNPARTAATPKKVEPAGPSKFLQQFEIIDDSPITIQWKNQQFQRKDATGDWVTFPGGKPAPDQMNAALDKVSPPAVATTKAPKPIAVKDNAGVVWTKDETTRTWKSGAGVVASPANAKELEKRALPQYQARQMSS